MYICMLLVYKGPIKGNKLLKYMYISDYFVVSLKKQPYLYMYLQCTELSFYLSW